MVRTKACGLVRWRSVWWPK